MKRILFNIRQVTVREIFRMSSGSLILMVTLILPVASTLFFWSLMKEGVPDKMPVAVVDLDHTPASRKLIRNIDITPLSQVIMQPESIAEALSELQKGNIYGFVVIPENLQADILASGQPVISYYYQNSFLIAGGLMQNDLTMILHTLSGGINIQKREAFGQNEEEIMAQVQPVSLNTHLLFNPWSNYSVYVTSIVLPVMLQIFILLMTVYSIGIEIKEKTSREWLRTSGKSVVVALTGKLLPYTAIFFIVMMFQNFILYKVLGIPMHTNAGWLVLISLIYVIAYQAVGIFIIGLLPIMRHGLNLSAFYAILAFSLCGFSYPVESMPSVFRFWAEAFPVRHYMHIFQKQILAGGDLFYSSPDYLFMLLFLLLPFTVLYRLKSALIHQNHIEDLPQSYHQITHA